ncbi:MAG: hypothetical protein ACLR8Y_19610 [Alistipes indistinctus]
MKPGQSRIRATPWQRRDLYTEKLARRFFADRASRLRSCCAMTITTVRCPWTQSIEYCIALRRLGKPVWLLNYNGRAARCPSRAAASMGLGQADVSVLRTTTSKGAPMPRWMKEECFG